MIKKRTIFVCNALEDLTRLERGISSDSPAASKKVFEMAYALRSVGEQALILSMGRGKSKKRMSFYKAKIVRMHGIPIVYAPFSDTLFISQLLSLISMPYFLYLLNSSSEKTVAVFYNRTSAYLTSLFMSLILGIGRILDLEDAEIIFPRNWSPYQLYLRGKRFIYDRLCSGTLLACRAVGNGIKRDSGLCYYGAVESFRPVKTWSPKTKYKLLLGGTVSRETGADILIEAIKLLRKNAEEWSTKLEFIITGKGDCVEQFKTLGNMENSPFVIVAGRLTDADYETMVNSCDVGLALKPNLGPLADTTFPSKVIELASAGLLVLTTDISDVKLVMGNNGAVYLNRDDPLELIGCLRWIVENPRLAEQIAVEGNYSVRGYCSMEMAGRKLANFVYRSDGMK